MVSRVLQSLQILFEFKNAGCSHEESHFIASSRWSVEKCNAPYRTIIQCVIAWFGTFEHFYDLFIIDNFIFDIYASYLFLSTTFCFCLFLVHSGCFVPFFLFWVRFRRLLRYAHIADRWRHQWIPEINKDYKTRKLTMRTFYSQFR